MPAKKRKKPFDLSRPLSLDDSSGKFQYEPEEVRKEAPKKRKPRRPAKGEGGQPK